MCHLLKVVLIILVTETLHFSVGFKWISLQSGDKIPVGAINIDENLGTYVGRARHYDELLPAEVYNSTHALILSCSKEIVKHKFEVLVASELCKWQHWNSISDIPENIVRAGNEADGEPIYIGLGSNGNNFRLAYVLLSGNRITNWIGHNNYQPLYALTCDDNNNWVDTSSRKIPNNTISGGQSADGNEVFVARLKRGCDIIPGQVIPDLGTAMAIDENTARHEDFDRYIDLDRDEDDDIYEDNERNGNTERYENIERYGRISSTYCQVLVGDQNNYSWVWAYDGEIPDYAVVNGKSPGGELRYVARMNKTLSYIGHNRAKVKGMAYEVLVKSKG